MQNLNPSIPGFPILNTELSPHTSVASLPAPETRPLTPDLGPQIAASILPRLTTDLTPLTSDDLLTSTRQQLDEAAQNAANLVANGEVDPLRALIYAKKGIELFSLYEKQVRPLAEGQHGIAQKEVYRAYNAEVVEKETGITVDCAACQDPVWNQYQQDLQQLKSVIKNREAYLKTITRPTEALINGCEVITLHPPLRKARLGLAVSLK